MKGVGDESNQIRLETVEAVSREHSSTVLYVAVAYRLRCAATNESENSDLYSTRHANFDTIRYEMQADAVAVAKSSRVVESRK